MYRQQELSDNELEQITGGITPPSPEEMQRMNNLSGRIYLPLSNIIRALSTIPQELLGRDPVPALGQLMGCQSVVYSCMFKPEDMQLFRVCYNAAKEYCAPMPDSMIRESFQQIDELLTLL